MAEVKSKRMLLQFIQEFVAEHGYPPSVRDCADELEVSYSTIHRWLRRLQGQGLIKMAPGIARSIQIIGPVMKAPEVTM